MLGRSKGATTADVAVDLGSAQTRVGTRGRGVDVDEPTVVATQRGPRGAKVVAVGTEAKRMMGRAPEGMRVVRPVRAGVVADFEAAEQLLSRLLGQAGIGGLRRPRLLMSVPSQTTEVERRALQDCARGAGAREVVLASRPLLAAVGAGLSVLDPIGNVVVDVGGGRTEVAVISLGGVVAGTSLPVGGDDFEGEIVRWLRDHHSLLVGERTAETLKHHIGAATLAVEPQRMRVRGRDLVTSIPRELDVSTEDLVAALEGPVRRIEEAVLGVLRETPPELAADIVDRGILLAGGSSHLRGLDLCLRECTALPVLQVEEPERAVIRGALQVLSEVDLFTRIADTA